MESYELLELFGNMHRIIWQHSIECLATFPGMFGDIPHNFCRYSLQKPFDPDNRIQNKC